VRVPGRTPACLSVSGVPVPGAGMPGAVQGCCVAPDPLVAAGLVRGLLGVLGVLG